MTSLITATDRPHDLIRAYVRQRSGLHLDLLNPNPNGWTDEDLAIGLSRTFRWGGHSIWPMPLSVAQHSLTVFILAARASARPFNAMQALREILHDGDEALIGGFDPISPLKPFLGPAFAALSARLKDAIFTRYEIVEWDAQEYRNHKTADILAAASEAVHVAGWNKREVLEILNIGLTPLKVDPLAEIYDCKPWEPWAPDVAAERFLNELKKQSRAVQTEKSVPLISV